MTPQQLTAILHAGVIGVGIVGYVVLTATGHDGNAVLAAALAWAGGAGVEKAIVSSSAETSKTPTPPSS